MNVGATIARTVQVRKARNPRVIHSTRYRYFAERLREARERAGLTQIEAAKRLGQSQSYLSKCELCERRVDLLEALDFARVYGQSLDFFVRKEDWPFGTQRLRAANTK